MVRHFISLHGDRKEVTHSKWPTNPQALGASTYIEGTRTFDNCRFAYSNFPLKLSFTDATNVKHEVWIENGSDEYTIVIMTNNQIKWHGDAQDVTGLDAQSGVAKITFSYIGSSWMPPQSHGIRVAVTGYRENGMGYYASDKESWESAVEMFVKSTEGVKNMAEAYAAVKGVKK